MKGFQFLSGKIGGLIPPMAAEAGLGKNGGSDKGF
jgi:hypothetical protein